MLAGDWLTGARADLRVAGVAGAHQASRPRTESRGAAAPASRAPARGADPAVRQPHLERQGHRQHGAAVSSNVRQRRRADRGRRRLSALPVRHRVAALLPIRE